MKILRGIILLALLSPNSVLAQFTYELHAASTGLGGTVGYRWSEQFAARGGWQGLKINDIDVDVEQDNQAGGVDTLKHNGDGTLNVGHMLVDWYPTGGRFRISAGAMINLSSIDVTSTCNAPDTGPVINPIPGNCEFGVGAFNAGELGEVKTDIEFNTLAPYVGIGWGHKANERWAVVADIGLAFTGSPKADMRATGSCNESAACRQQIENEEKELEKDLENLKLYPVLSLGFSYRFAR